MALFRDEFEFGFVIQRGLLRFGQPCFAERLQTRQVVRRHGVIGQKRRFKRQFRARVGVELSRQRQISCLLKNRNRRARLRPDRGVYRTW